MQSRAFAFLVLLFSAVIAVQAADRQWQAGTWTEVNVKRKVVDFGPGSAGFGAPSTVPSMRAMADVHTYVIETPDLRIELEDVVQIGRRTVEAVVGSLVTFALDKKTVYVRDAEGLEYRLRVTKKIAKPKS